MNSKNMTKAEREHVALIKSLPCGVCAAPAPSDAHHIEQGEHFIVIPLCKDCHQGPHNGIHGERVMWKIMKKTELSVLNETVQKIKQMVRVAA